MWSETFNSYYQLCKPKVVALIVFTAVAGMFLSTPGMVPWMPLLLGTIGIGLASASAAAINHVLDERFDERMGRTKNRPLPTKQLSSGQAVAFALSLAVISMIILVRWVNPLTAVLTFVALIGYAVIYTAYLKHATPQNIVIGGAAGAAPPVLGWVAITGHVHPDSLLLFLIIFAWTPPHFWALAIAKRDDYAKAGIPMLPVTHGVRHTTLQILLYTVIMVVITILPFLTGMGGLLYLAAALILGGIFIAKAWALQKTPRYDLAMGLFGYSITYLMVLFAVMLLDHYLMPGGQVLS
ncbi:MAG: heme o synthase [Gammaproteobacteria bacterium]